MSEEALYVGCDVGSSRTKVAVIDAAGRLRGLAVRKSGTDFTATADGCLAEALAMAGGDPGRIARAVSTGYGRMNVRYAQDQRTEIGCHAGGCYHAFPRAITVIDIGGQDNKVIKLDAAGRRTAFKMNRKCAAGTGAFLEEMAARLDIPLERMNAMAESSSDMVRLGSFCTVFSATEVLEHIRHGKKIEDIVKGVFYSMIKRIVEMDSLTAEVVMTGGVVAHNPYLVRMMEELIGRPVLVPPHPQFTGAIGAALYARSGSRES